MGIFNKKTSKKNKGNILVNEEDIFLRPTTDKDSDLESILNKQQDRKKYKLEFFVHLNVPFLGLLAASSFFLTGFSFYVYEKNQSYQSEVNFHISKISKNFKSQEQKTYSANNFKDKTIEELIFHVSENQFHLNNINTKLVNFYQLHKNELQLIQDLNRLSLDKSKSIKNEQESINIAFENFEFLDKNQKTLFDKLKNLKTELGKQPDLNALILSSTLESLVYQLVYQINKKNDENIDLIHQKINNISKEIKTKYNSTNVFNEINIIESIIENNFLKFNISKNINTIKLLEQNLFSINDNSKKSQVLIEKIILDLQNQKPIDLLGFSYQKISLISFFTGIIFLILISLTLYARSMTTLKLANVFKKNQSNEDALSELLEQIKPLDNGDFTRPIFVEDKFLFNISKRIDKTREQFGDIVRQMKVSSTNILNAAGTTDQSSQELLVLSKKQYEKLSESIKVINNITNSIDEVAQTAWVAKDESLKSSSESEIGKDLVEQSIQKMSQIRLTIQESSKKIKKLGESAQSINEVTALIKDITKQINILALNAAIQAASSGESGREFTIVAQEVQRLAYDSEEATRKIEDLILTIQKDTAAAISSMEKTTQEVVIGANLTEKTGIALQTINNLSKNTAEQIMDASSKLEERSSEIAKVTFEMQSLQDISKVAQQALDITATQVEKLKVISVELEETFKKYKV